jgi:hypothetical protein
VRYSSKAADHRPVSQSKVHFDADAGGLYRLSQMGGTPTQVTKSDANQGEVGYLRPWFLPDGQHFLYITRVRQEPGFHRFARSEDAAGAHRFGHEPAYTRHRWPEIVMVMTNLPDLLYHKYSGT